MVQETQDTTSAGVTDTKKADPCCGSGKIGATLISVLLGALIAAVAMHYSQQQTLKLYIDISKQAREACVEDKRPIDVSPIRPRPVNPGIGVGVPQEGSG